MYEMNEKEEQDEFKIVGRPIVGEQYNPRNIPQPATAAEFMEAIDAILSIPGIYGARWEQYTPYFADGEPCEFSVNEVSVRFSPLDDEEDERGDYEDGWIETYSLSYSRGDFKDLNDEDFEALKKAVSNWGKLNADEVARRNFGDHAQVTATLEGFSVEYYEHD